MMQNKKTLLSTLWVFAILNYIYADVFTSFFGPALQPEVAKELVSGYVGTMQITEGMILVFAVLLETAIAMVLLSRILEHKWNRRVNVAMGVFHTLFVAWSLIQPGLSLFYAFFAAIEIITTLFIVWYAWRWKQAEN